MHTVWVRLNAVVFFGLTVLLGLSVLTALSTALHKGSDGRGRYVTHDGYLHCTVQHRSLSSALCSFQYYVAPEVVSGLEIHTMPGNARIFIYVDSHFLVAFSRNDDWG